MEQCCNYIYALIDPRNDEVRYVGKACRPKERLMNQRNERANTHRCHWLMSLSEIGLKPIQIILETVPVDRNWQEREMYWISHYRQLGVPLTNGTDGGDGVLNICPEAKAKMIKTWLGRKHKPESLIKIGLASRGRTHDDNWRAAMSNRMKGRIFSPEHRVRLSLGVSKLNSEQVKEIKVLLSQKVPQRTIAKIFRVHQGTISNLNRGKCYSNISGRLA